MPSLDQMTRGINRKNFTRVMPEPTHTQEVSSAPMLPVNPGVYTICPMPLIKAFPDDLRQFSRDGVAQMRVIPPQE